uniref:Uncharacterized protein n=1 Tax=Arundo donax TaxID=35708 RepID=A0A0A8Y892_ARUDO
MDLVVIHRATPPKVGDICGDLLADLARDFEAAHSIDRD